MIVELKGYEEKIRVVLNKADSIDTQALMRVYGALMWSLGKVKQTPEVTRVYISSFWEKPFQNTENEQLFTAEREDLFKELRDLPRYSAIRKINDLVKRARYIKVHALLIGHLKSKMPSLMGKASTQKKLLQTMDQVFRAVQREHQLPFGDFPNLEEFKASIQDMDFSKFPKLDLRAIEAMDTVLSKDVPALMAQFPPERQDEAQAQRVNYAAAMSGADDGGGGGAATAPARPAAPANPFMQAGTGADTTTWLITPQDQVCGGATVYALPFFCTRRCDTGGVHSGAALVQARSAYPDAGSRATGQVPEHLSQLWPRGWARGWRAS